MDAPKAPKTSGTATAIDCTSDIRTPIASLQLALQEAGAHARDSEAPSGPLKRALEDILPRDILYRKKMGFPTPWSRWLQGDQLSEVEKMLTSERSLARGLFRPESLHRLSDRDRAFLRHEVTASWYYQEPVVGRRVS